MNKSFLIKNNIEIQLENRVKLSDRTKKGSKFQTKIKLMIDKKMKK